MTTSSRLPDRPPTRRWTARTPSRVGRAARHHRRWVGSGPAVGDTRSRRTARTAKGSTPSGSGHGIVDRRWTGRGHHRRRSGDDNISGDIDLADLTLSTATRSRAARASTSSTAAAAMTTSMADWTRTSSGATAGTTSWSADRGTSGMCCSATTGMMTCSKAAVGTTVSRRRRERHPTLRRIGQRHHPRWDGNDDLEGGIGNDTLIGGPDDDSQDGGPNHDSCQVDPADHTPIRCGSPPRGASGRRDSPATGCRYVLAAINPESSTHRGVIVPVEGDTDRVLSVEIRATFDDEEAP